LGGLQPVDAVKWVERAQSLQIRVTSSLEVAKETLTPHAKTAGEVASVGGMTRGDPKNCRKGTIGQIRNDGVLSSALEMGHCKYYGAPYLVIDQT
jgi:hypothetical protein